MQIRLYSGSGEQAHDVIVHQLLKKETIL